jgi:hypothetical protein
VGHAPVGDQRASDVERRSDTQAGRDRVRETIRVKPLVAAPIAALSVSVPRDRGGAPLAFLNAEGAKLNLFQPGHPAAGRKHAHSAFHRVPPSVAVQSAPETDPGRSPTPQMIENVGKDDAIVRPDTERITRSRLQISRRDAFIRFDVR